MPLTPGSSDHAIKKNIAELVRSGHDVKQAAAIAYKKAGRYHGPKQVKGHDKDR